VNRDIVVKVVGSLKGKKKVTVSGSGVEIGCLSYTSQVVISL